ncbi:hypothetical protein ILUMI_20091 [Ignelater luminosus]|uniref:Uncharacterized protein n=1 Tax=Ignelater luminosus TaxID=2038154 RepID=A0A8K0CKD8_IGNLU|nr:hypothetical protein ILUMI_20091 [Ignelater luminosus]
MSMTKKDKENIRRAEKNILRAIMGPKKINENEHQRRTNEKIEEDYSDDIIKRIKEQRSEGNNIAKIKTNWEPAGKPRGCRPRSNWFKKVREELARTGLVHKYRGKRMEKDMQKN